MKHAYTELISTILQQIIITASPEINNNVHLVIIKYFINARVQRILGFTVKVRSAHRKRVGGCSLTISNSWLKTTL